MRLLLAYIVIVVYYIFSSMPKLKFWIHSRLEKKLKTPMYIEEIAKS